MVPVSGVCVMWREVGVGGSRDGGCKRDCVELVKQVILNVWYVYRMR